MKRRTFIQGAGVSALGITLGFPNILLAQEKREFRLGIATPPKHPWNETAARIGEILAEETNERLSISVFPAGQLGSEAAMLQQLQSGALDMAFLQVTELGARVPQIGAVLAPKLVDSTEKAAKLVQQPEVQGLLDLLPAETGTVGLGWGITGIRAVFSASEIDSLKDMDGMKLRINVTPQYRDFYQSLGAVPTPVPTPEAFDAMANGQVDGLEADLDFSWNQRFDKVSKSILRMNALFMPVIAVFSGRVWATLSEEDRELIRNITQEALVEMNQQIVNNEQGILEELEKTGIKMTVASDDEAAAVIEQWDEMWIERAPNIPELRAVGARL